MPKIGCFIEPTGVLRSEIIQLKTWSRSNFSGSQKYLDHPAHLTLFTLEVKDQSHNEIISKVNRIAESQLAFEIITRNYLIFQNDALTGGHTFTIEVEKSDQLVDLQHNLLKALQHLRQPSDYEVNICNDVFHRNLKELGFPFAGEIWKPHFTITSFEKSIENEDKMESFGERKDKQSFLVCGISLWEIENDIHRKIHMVEFKN